MKKKYSGIRCYSTQWGMGVLVLILAIVTCSCDYIGYLSPSEIVQLLDEQMPTQSIDSFFASESREFNESLIDCYIDNSMGMRGYLNRTRRDMMNRDCGLSDLIDQIKIIPSKINFKAFDGGDLKAVSTENLNLVKQEVFYSHYLTPLNDNIEKIMDRINTNQLDGAIIVTDGIEDLGYGTDDCLYIHSIRNWIGNKKNFEMIAFPLFFRGVRWYPPIKQMPQDQQNLLCQDYSEFPCSQYLYILIFSNKKFSNQSLGQQIYPYIAKAYPYKNIEYSDYSYSFVHSRIGFFKENAKKDISGKVTRDTFQNDILEKEHNPDLYYMEGDSTTSYFNYRFNHMRKKELIIMDSNGKKETVFLNSKRMSIGKLQGVISTSNLSVLGNSKADIEKSNLMIRYAYWIYDAKAKKMKPISMDSPFGESQDFSLQIVDCEFKRVPPLNENHEFNSYHHYQIVTDNILLPIPKYQEKTALYIKLEVMMPLPHYAKTITSAFYDTQAGITVKGYQAIVDGEKYFVGLREQEIFEECSNLLHKKENLSVFTGYLKVDF